MGAAWPLVAGSSTVPQQPQPCESTQRWTLASCKTGLLGSTFHVVLHTPDTMLQSAQRLASSTLTMAAVGAIFGAATCTASHLREDRDDPWNYFIGGCAAGTMFGARTHNFALGTYSCVVLGTAASLVKMGKLEGWRFMGPRQT
ncbi:hypothetical protein JRQ81_008961 [Phrynocephalus forsythii]|uniref:NADH dehydrogenase [ubiquinone] 1 alpha subcomplex subunit 11 n=1 Tax=Phrynocephalus forsythii TaxID=171643 RepID=A0A9Q0XD16_9SAUR|nr:hypothetical protein JRQ81_008961 [Phrynocephalus forsythii]